VTDETKAVRVNKIATDERCQTRVELDQATVDVYADSLKDDVDLGALDVFEVDGVMYLVDGFHRLAACVQIGKPFVRVRIVGSSSEIEGATWEALSKNKKHGLRLSRADKKRAVWMALDAGFGEMLDDPNDPASRRGLAQHLGVSHPFVSKVRAEWEAERSGNVTTEAADTDAEPVADTEDAQGTPGDTEPADDAARYRSAAKRIDRLWVALCNDLGAADPVCEQVNEAKRLALKGAE